MRHFSLFVFAGLITISGFCQNQQFIGISLNPEFKNFNSVVLSYGVTYENQLSKHSGFEVDLLYRSSVNHFVVDALPLGIFNYNAKVRENYLSLPVMYKFYTDLVNISVGISLNTFVGWQDLSAGALTLNSYIVNPNFYVGWIAKVGKPFSLSSKLVLEPEIYINPNIVYGDSYAGISVKLKYKL